MRAIVAEGPGGPEVLTVKDVPAPVPGPGELLVQTAATGVNFLETYQRSGTYKVPFPFTPGGEAAGTVLAVGEGVEDFAPGDRVTTSMAAATYAEQFLVAAVGVARVPDDVDLRTAAALSLQGATAHYLATSAAKPAAGDTVLVHAGAGGVGLLLTQLLVARGVHVLTTASTDEKRELSLAAGAAESFGYADFADRARSLTAGEGVAVVYDGVGRDTFDDSLRALRIRGTLVLFGLTSGPVPPFDLQLLATGGSLTIVRPSLPHFMRTPEERAWRYSELFEAVEAGTLTARIGATHGLDDAAGAHRALVGRGTTGKVILVP